ncbi:MAG TPA: hypothetical protein P5121_29320 [Caldilineaceae bacterium]|nr:hypothetical protein [Caldilineaceae bacterium]HRW09250.1 hypothetical protein [Caldilineaceae bacterium]
MSRIWLVWTQPLVILVLLVSLVVVTVAPVSACSCIAITPAEEFSEAGAVFVGEVSAIEEDEANQQVYVQFSVRHTWKGEAEMVRTAEYDEVTVTTPLSGAACGYEFSLHERYLVYARAGADGLTVGSCGNTAPLLDALDQLAVVGTEQSSAVDNQPTSPLAAPTSPLPTPTRTPRPKR